MARRIALPSVALLALLLLAPASAAQALDGLWFKMTVAAKGAGVDQVSGDVGKIKGKVVAYMFVQLDELEPEGGASVVPYRATVYGETSPDNWTPSEVGVFFLSVGADETLLTGPLLGSSVIEIEIPLEEPEIEGGASEALRVGFTAKAKVKRDKEGAVKSVSFTSYGAVIPGGSSEGEDLYGGAKVKAKSVDPSKLPFGVVIIG